MPTDVYIEITDYELMGMAPADRAEFDALKQEQAELEASLEAVRRHRAGIKKLARLRVEVGRLRLEASRLLKRKGPQS